MLKSEWIMKWDCIQINEKYDWNGTQCMKHQEQARTIETPRSSSRNTEYHSLSAATREVTCTRHLGGPHTTAAVFLWPACLSPTATWAPPPDPQNTTPLSLSESLPRWRDLYSCCLFLCLCHKTHMKWTLNLHSRT